jgi:hypothetical protein
LYGLPCTTIPFNLKISVVCYTFIGAHAKLLWYAVMEGKELHLTPDVLAGIYQCNISHLDNPLIQTSNPDLR